MAPSGDIAPTYSEEFLALRFAERHARDFRYVAKFGQWRRWDGNRWVIDHTLSALNSCRQTAREAAGGCNDIKTAVALASAKTVTAIERLAKADPRLAATCDDWDADPWLLNTPGGVVDLRTGALIPHLPELYMTKMAATGPGGEYPLWLAFLDRVTNGDADLIAYLQRLLGYTLTGVTQEHALAFLYGHGANGKSVLLSTVAGILGDYHRTAPIETFTVTNNQGHPTDLAGLMGARLVTASETEEGRRWAESKIKMMTGGDRVTARFMRQDFFEYTPQFKLVIAGNHKPGLRSVDEAIRRRFHLVPFLITIPPHERDPQLAEKLRAEWPGILAWMIQGCLEWQRVGLAPPEAVRSATADYLNSEDAYAAWKADCCKHDPAGFESTADLFSSWMAWTARTGEYAGSRKRFRDKLKEDTEFEEKNSGQARGFAGVRLTNLDA